MKIGVYSFPEGKEPKDLIDEIKRLKYDVGNLGYKIKNQRHEINNRLKENNKLKELLEECGIFLDVHRKEDGDVIINNVSTSQMIDKINEALK